MEMATEGRPGEDTIYKLRSFSGNQKKPCQNFDLGPSLHNSEEINFCHLENSVCGAQGEIGITGDVLISAAHQIALHAHNLNVAPVKEICSVACFLQ